MRGEEKWNRGELPNSNAMKSLARDARKVIASSSKGMEAVELLTRIDHMAEAWSDVPGADPVVAEELAREVEGVTV